MRYNSGMAARDDEKVKRTIASNIAHYRKECNLTQDELAELIFYSGKSVSKWERGDGVPDICVLVALADIFGVTVNDMLAEKHRKKHHEHTYHYEPIAYNPCLTHIVSSLSLPPAGVSGRNR